MRLFIDIGSTNIKYKTSNQEAVFFHPFPNPTVDQYPLFEVDPNAIIQIVKEIIGKTQPTDLYISTQMHGYVLFNKGNPVTNYISWRDERGKESLPSFSISKAYGVDIKPNLPRLSLQVNTKEFDEFMTLGSYVVYSLTGHNASHVTDIAATGFYNTVNRVYDKTTFKMPRVFHDLSKVGFFGDINVYPPIGDQQASILGVISKGHYEKSYILNIGTASQLCCIENGHPEGEFESRPFFDKKTLCTVTRLAGGAAISKIPDDKIEGFLLEEYRKAVAKLPKKDSIVVTGGASTKYRTTLEKVLQKLGINYEFNESCDALEGLDIVSLTGENTMNKVGLMLSEIPHHSIPTLLKQSGLDFFILDCEHGGFDYLAMSQIILNAKLAGIKVIVRLPNNLRKDIIKTLDMGADGLLLPMTNTPEDIQCVVEYAKYPPLGKRGVSTMRAHTLYNPPAILDYMSAANEKIEIYAQIETISGVNNIDSILLVDGVTGILMGPNDLSGDYGCLGDSNALEILHAIECVGSSCLEHKKTCGIITGNKSYLAKAKLFGFHILCIGSELNAIANYCKTILKDNQN